MLRSSLWACLILAQASPPSKAGPMPNDDTRNSPAAFMRADSGSRLARALRELLVLNMPTPLYEAHPGWGRTAMFITGIEWSGKGLHVHSRTRKEARNDGTWQKVRI